MKHVYQFTGGGGTWLTGIFCLLIRPISEEEIKHLNERHYTAITDKQKLIDQQLQGEVSLLYLHLLPQHPVIIILVGNVWDLFFFVLAFFVFSVV